MAHARFKLVEECAGTGDLMQDGAVLGRVRYRLDRYQGMLEGSGMPIPGLHRVEGSVEAGQQAALAARAGESVTLRLEDGRTVALTLADDEGRVLAEGHGPGRGCSCC